MDCFDHRLARSNQVKGRLDPVLVCFGPVLTRFGHVNAPTDHVRASTGHVRASTDNVRGAGNDVKRCRGRFSPRTEGVKSCREDEKGPHGAPVGPHG
jgi:hypothetical protein